MLRNKSLKTPQKLLRIIGCHDAALRQRAVALTDSPAPSLPTSISSAPPSVAVTRKVTWSSPPSPPAEASRRPRRPRHCQPIPPPAYFSDSDDEPEVRGAPDGDLYKEAEFEDYFEDEGAQWEAALHRND